MAVDPDDFLDPPYGLGDCNEITLFCTAKCASWETPKHEFKIHLRNRGNLTEVIIPELIFKSKGDTTEDLIQFSLPSFDSLGVYFGSYPESMRFSAFGLNGCERNSDEITHETCVCIVDMDFAGNFYIAPEENDEGFSSGEDHDPIGLFSFSFSFTPNNTEPDEDTNPRTKKTRTT